MGSKFTSLEQTSCVQVLNISFPRPLGPPRFGTLKKSPFYGKTASYTEKRLTSCVYPHAHRRTHTPCVFNNLTHCSHLFCAGCTNERIFPLSAWIKSQLSSSLALSGRAQTSCTAGPGPPVHTLGSLF